MTIADTPHSIALGSASEFSSGSPRCIAEDVVSIAVAWIFRCNKIAAAIAVNAARCSDLGNAGNLCRRIHLGCWSLQRPVAQRVHFRQFGLSDYMHWHVFSRVVWPTFWPALLVQSSAEFWRG